MATSETTSPNEIEVKDLGAVSRQLIHLPDGGGVLRLLGRNGAGKSTILDAVQARLRGSGTGLESRDGTSRGLIRIGEAKITVGKSNRCSGKLEVIHLEDRLNIAELVDPKLKDQVAADGRRIKALVSLAASDGWLDKFKSELSAITDIDWEAVKGCDPVETARKIKDQLHAIAREAEGDAKQATIKAEAVREAWPAVAYDGPGQDELRKALLEANRRHATIEERAKAAREANSRAEEARRAIAHEEESYSGPTAQAARIALSEASEAKRQAEAACVQARAALEEAISKHDKAALVHEEASGREKMMAAWRETIEAGKVEQVTDQEIDAAIEATEKAQEACDLEVKARETREHHQEAEVLEAGARVNKGRADVLRDAAKQADHILGSLIECDALRVKGGRLVTDHARGEIPFSELSDGERWAIALKVAEQNMPDGGLIVIPQASWGELDPVNRDEIDQLCVQLGIHGLTAEAAMARENVEAAEGHASDPIHASEGCGE